MDEKQMNVKRSQEDMKYKGCECRRKAHDLTIQAEIYEDCAWRLLAAIEKDAQEPEA